MLSRKTLDALGEVACIVGSFLEFKDRKAFCLAHPRFATAHVINEYQDWNVHTAPASPDIWGKKMRALLKYKPRLKGVNIKVHADLSYADIECILRIIAAHPQINIWLMMLNIGITIEHYVRCVCDHPELAQLNTTRWETIIASMEDVHRLEAVIDLSNRAGYQPKLHLHVHSHINEVSEMVLRVDGTKLVTRVIVHSNCCREKLNEPLERFLGGVVDVNVVNNFPHRLDDQRLIQLATSVLNIVCTNHSVSSFDNLRFLCTSCPRLKSLYLHDLSVVDIMTHSEAADIFKRLPKGCSVHFTGYCLTQPFLPLFMRWMQDLRADLHIVCTLLPEDEDMTVICMSLMRIRLIQSGMLSERLCCSPDGLREEGKDVLLAMLKDCNLYLGLAWEQVMDVAPTADSRVSSGRTQKNYK